MVAEELLVQLRIYVSAVVAVVVVAVAFEANACVVYAMAVHADPVGAVEIFQQTRSYRQQVSCLEYALFHSHRVS